MVIRLTASKSWKMPSLIWAMISGKLGFPQQRNSLVVHLKTLSKHNKVKKWLIWYPPGAMIYIEALTVIVRSRLDELSLRDSDHPSLGHIRGGQFFRKADHVACRVHEVYNMTRIQKAAHESAGALYQLTQLDIQNLLILGTICG